MAFIRLKGENGVELEVHDHSVTLNFTVGQNIRLINEKYNSVKKLESAVAVEWMVRGEEALRDYLGRLSLRHENLGETLKRRLKEDLNSIKTIANNISTTDDEKGVIQEDKLFENKKIMITVKRVKGRWRKSFPAVNVVFPLTDCKQVGEKYQVKLDFQEAVEIGYKILFWITCSDLSENKGFETAELILGKIE